MKELILQWSTDQKTHDEVDDIRAMLKRDGIETIINHNPCPKYHIELHFATKEDALLYKLTDPCVHNANFREVEI